MLVVSALLSTRDKNKKDMKKGDKVKVLEMLGEPHMAGVTGVVDYIDGIGQIHVKWDNGSTLALIPGKDRYRVN